MVDLIRAHRDMSLLLEVESHLRLARYAPGRIEFEPAPGAPADLASRLGQRLQGWTGARWGVSVVGSGGAPSIAEARAAEQDERTAHAMAHPLIQAVFAAFPTARITEIRSLEDVAQAAAEAALPEVDEEWDPFADD